MGHLPLFLPPVVVTNGDFDRTKRSPAWIMLVVHPSGADSVVQKMIPSGTDVDAS